MLGKNSIKQIAMLPILNLNCKRWNLQSHIRDLKSPRGFIPLERILWLLWLKAVCVNNVWINFYHFKSLEYLVKRKCWPYFRIAIIFFINTNLTYDFPLLNVQMMLNISMMIFAAKFGSFTIHRKYASDADGCLLKYIFYVITLFIRLFYAT